MRILVLLATAVCLHGQLQVLPAPAEFARMKAMRFRARSDHDTALAVVLKERGGGSYHAVFWSPANTWQQIELTPADFALSDGPADPPDPDGKLDLDAVQSIALVDMAQVFRRAPANPEFPVIIDRDTATHSVAVEKLETLQTARPPARSGSIDSFDRPFLCWMTLGGMTLARSGADGPLHEPALRASYAEKEDGFAVLTRSLAELDLAGATALEFDIASEQEITLVIGLEMLDKKRFNATIYPPGKREVFHVLQKFSDFSGAGTLDAAKLRSISFVDVSSVQGGAAMERNTVWIGNVRATR